MKYILGISCFYHDSAACLICDGKIIAAVQEERFTRKKHDPRFPKNAIEYCLSEAKITIDDLDFVVYYDKPFLTFERLLMSYLSVAPKGLLSWLKAMPLWLGKKLHIPRVIEQELGYTGDVLFTEHHEAHAASAFYPSPFRDSAILTVDGVGEWATASWGYGENNNIYLSHELQFPHSLGLLYSAFTYFTGFRVNSGEYKLMGLAPYGKPIYRDIILDELVDVKEDGSLRLNLSYFDFLGGLRMTNKRFDRLFNGPPRKPESEITKREMNIAASIQVVTEEIMLKMARHVHRETGKNYLCLAGGVALNCVANGRILREGPFHNIWIQPAAGDAGGALGAALSVWYRYLGNKRLLSSHEDLQKGSFLGPGFSNEDIELYLNLHKYPFHRLGPDSRARTIAGHIAEGKVVGHFCGRMEFGPRALGTRSILGDPRNPDMQRIMNLKIKYRESFRPFAPAFLEERVSEFMDFSHPSRYMLLVGFIKEEKRYRQEGSTCSLLELLNQKRSDIPAVTHIDYSARIQTVRKQDNPRFYDILDEFNKMTGCPALINTSFNVRGEPIVCTPEDAYRCFMRTEMDILVMEGCLLCKGEQPPWPEGREWESEYILD